MTIKEFIQQNPFRVMGTFINDSSDIIASNYSKMKAFAAIGKTVDSLCDMEKIFGTNPNRQVDALSASVATLSSPDERLLKGMFWFMNMTTTDAKALAVLAQSGDLLLARRIWEDGEQDMSSLQNQMMCCLLMDPRSYSKAIHLASSLYASYGSEFIVTVCNGFEVITADRLMPTFLGEIVNASDGIWWWDKAVKRQGDMAIGYLWSEAKAAYHIGKLQDALNVAKTTELRSIQDHYIIAQCLMNHAESHLKELRKLKDSHSSLLSRYSTIADAVCEEILNREIAYYNRVDWYVGKSDCALVLIRFCYRYAATVRFKERCKLNINITLGRKVDAPLFPNGTPDKLLFASERSKRNALICGIMDGLSHHTERRM